MKPLALGVLWAAVLYRSYVLRRGGLAAWRIYLLVAIAALAVATTFHFYRTEVDVVLRVPSLAGLVDRVVLTVAWVAVQLYLLDLRRIDGRTHARARETRLITALVVIAAMAVAWVAIPVHDSDITDLTPYAREPAVLIYTAGFYSYVVWLLVDLGSYAGSRMRAIRRSDPFGAIAGALIAVACALGVVVMGLYIAYVVLAFAGLRYSALDRWGTLLFPAPMALLALGLLLIPLGPRLARWSRARRELREIEELWAHLVSARPGVHLDRGRGLPRTLAAPGGVLQRRLIETADALADVDVPFAVPAAPEALAGALCRPLPRGAGRPAAEVLKSLSQGRQEADVLVALGRAFHHARTPRI